MNLPVPFRGGPRSRLSLEISEKDMCIEKNLLKQAEDFCIEMIALGWTVTRRHDGARMVLVLTFIPEQKSP